MDHIHTIENPNYSEEKRLLIEARLEKLQKERDAKKEERKQHATTRKNEEEDLFYIQQKFEQQKLAILQGLGGFKEEVEGDKEKMVEELYGLLTVKLKELRQYIANYSFCIPKFDIMRYNQSISMLVELIQEHKEKAIPKKKFQFPQKLREKYAKKEKGEVKPLPKKGSKIQFIPSFRDLVFQDIKDQVIWKDRTDLDKQENLYLQNISNCTIFLGFGVKSVYMTDIESSRIYLGAVSGGAIIHHMMNSTLFVSTHQLRIHYTENTKFYIFGRSNPIIEFSQDLQFTSNEKCEYAEKEEDIKRAGFEGVPNLYADVLDFNWLKKEQSPNWKTFTQNETIIYKEQYEKFKLQSNEES